MTNSIFNQHTFSSSVHIQYIFSSNMFSTFEQPMAHDKQERSRVYTPAELSFL